MTAPIGPQQAELFPQGAPAPWKAWFGLAILCTAVLLGTADQQLRAMLAEPIRRALSLTDLQLGHLNGFAVAIVAAVAAPLMGWIADRVDRRWVLAASVLLWCGATFASGLANNFEQMLWAAVGLALGEAALIPIVYAMVADWFPPNRRARANAILYAVILLGAGMTLGAAGAAYGWMEGNRAALPAEWQVETWRLMFFVGALPGLVVAAALLLTPNVRARRSADRPSLKPGATRTPLLNHLRQHAGSIVGIYIGSMLYASAWGMLMMWTAPILGRSYGMPVGEAGQWMGGIAMAASVLGVALGYVAHSQWLQGQGAAGAIRLARNGALAAALPVALMLVDGGLIWYCTMLFIASTLLVMATSQAPAILQCVAPNEIRSRVIGLYALVVLPLRGAFPVGIGMLSDALASRIEHPLLMATATTSLAGLLLGALVMWRFERGYGAMGDAVLQAERLPAMPVAHTGAAQR